MSICYIDTDYHCQCSGDNIDPNCFVVHQFCIMFTHGIITLLSISHIRQKRISKSDVVQYNCNIPLCEFF